MFSALGATGGGQLGANEHQSFMIDGLWALTFGGASNAGPDTLYFTAGPGQEQNGPFGSIQANTSGHNDAFASNQDRD
jgi:hypothetical protein